MVYVKEEEEMITHLVENCSIDQQWGHLYSLKDEGAEIAQKHGHTLAPLTEEQTAVIQKGRILLTLRG